MRFAAAIGTAVLFSASKLASGFALSKLSGWVRERRLPAFPRGVRALHWVALLALPVAVNYHAPAWNSLLKQVRVFKHSSNFIRWFGVYVPIGCYEATFGYRLEWFPRRTSQRLVDLANLSGMSGLVAILMRYCARAARRAFTARAHP